MPEAELYGPIKLFLEAQGYVVKGEIGACDVMAVKGEEGPVVVELKERLSLALILQAADRLAFSDTVYVAFRIGQGQSASWRTRRKQVTGLLRRLGLGLLTVSPRGHVVPVLDPAPYRPRTRAGRRERLLKEFAERVSGIQRGWRLILPGTTHSVPSGRATMRTPARGPGCSQGQRPERAYRSVASRPDTARQPLRVV